MAEQEEKTKKLTLVILSYNVMLCHVMSCYVMRCQCDVNVMTGGRAAETGDQQGAR